VPLPEGRLGIVVADVSGHGLPAALIMSAFRALVRTSLRAGHALDMVARILNRELPDFTTQAAFVTAWLGVLDPAAGQLRYVNCGHPPPLHERADAAPDWLGVGGPLLGPLDHARFDTGVVELGAGDQVVLFTDGLVEARNGTGSLFGTRRLSEMVAANRALSAPDLVESLVLEAQAFTGMADFDDDVTLVLLRRTA